MNPSAEFTPEQEVLLWALRIDRTRDERISGILRNGINWDTLRRNAVRHNIVPLLYQRLKGSMADLVPPEELAEYRMLYRENAVQNIGMTKHLISVLDLLSKAGIPAMPYKGPALSVQAYGNLSMRSYSDLDILVHESDISRTYRILTESGFVLRYPCQMNMERRFAFLDEKDLSLTHQGDILEIHWKVIEQLYAVPLDMDCIWDRSRPVCISGREFMTVSPGDMILLLCFHGHKHGWQSLGWLADLVYLTANHADLPWQDLLLSAEQRGLRRIVLTALWLAHRHGGVDFGPGIERLCATDTKMQDLAREIQRSLFRSQEQAIGPLFYLKSRERLTDKARFLLYYTAHRFLVLVRWIIRPFTNREVLQKNDGTLPDLPKDQ